MIPLAWLLLEHGAQAWGTGFALPNHALFLALWAKEYDLANKLLDRGASLKQQSLHLEDEEFRKGREALIQLESAYSYPWDNADQQWLAEHLAPLLPLAPIVEKPCFWREQDDSLEWHTFMDAVMGDVAQLRHFEERGLDTRPTAEELHAAIRHRHVAGLCHVLTRHGSKQVAEEALRRIRTRWPEFGMD